MNNRNNSSFPHVGLSAMTGNSGIVGPSNYVPPPPPDFSLDFSQSKNSMYMFFFNEEWVS